VTYSILRRLSVCCVVVAALVALSFRPLFAQSIADVMRAWELRRGGIDTLRCVTAGSQTVAPGAFDASLEAPMSNFPSGTKSPVPAMEHRSAYSYACLFDFRNHRARAEEIRPVFDSRSVSFNQGTFIRAFDGIVNRYVDLAGLTATSKSAHFFDNLPQAFGYTSEWPALLACGYAPPDPLPKSAQYVMLSQSADRLSIAGNADLDGTPVLVVRTAPKLGAEGYYQEFWIEPGAECRIDKWLRYASGSVIESAVISYSDKSREAQPTAFSNARFLASGKVSETCTLAVREWAVNPAVHKSDFVLTPTSGMVLLDGNEARRLDLEAR